MKKYLPLLAFIVILGGLLACGSDNPAASAVTPSSSTPSNQHFKVGETVKVGDWEITVTKAEPNNGTEFFKPADGNQFLNISASLHNLSSKEQSVSSIIFFDLKDADGNKAKSALTSSDPVLGGKVEAGGKLAGLVGFEVKKETKNFILTFSPGFGGGSALFDINI